MTCGGHGLLERDDAIAFRSLFRSSRSPESSPTLRRSGAKVLRDDVVYPRINRAEYAPTIYAPAAEMLFGAIGFVWSSVTGVKTVMVIGRNAGGVLSAGPAAGREAAGPEPV